MAMRDLFFAVIAVASLVAQSRPSFDAASIKPGDSLSGFQQVRLVGDRLAATDASLRALVQFAYQTRDGRRFFTSQIVDAPRWVEIDRFDVQAKAGTAGGTIAPRQLQLMTQVMLEDRFHLRIHREMRELPVYDFVASKGGTKLKLAADQTPTAIDGDPIALDPSAPRGRFKQIGRPSPSGAITLVITGTAVTMTAFINMLQQYVDRPIVNSSGAAGLYDVRLEFGLAPSQSATEEAPGVSVFTAVQEQLGVKLDALKKPIEVLVIDHAERPTAN